MGNYLIRRLLLLPLTLFLIVLVNFVIINLAPGEPVTMTEITPEGTARRQENGQFAFGSDERYLQFREHFGLTLPILFNFWPWTSENSLKEKLQTLISGREQISVKEYDALRLNLGDRARFVMPKLLEIIEDSKTSPMMQTMAAQFFARGGSRQAMTGPTLTREEKRWNQQVSEDNQRLRHLMILAKDSPELRQEKVSGMEKWYLENKERLTLDPNFFQKTKMLVTQTRFFRFLSRVLTLDFGTLRDDPNKTVISEVTKRFKYSLTLSLLPMFLTFFLCQIFGFTMAVYHQRTPDIGLNVTFLILYAIPIFVVAPFLIEMALHRNFPFTDIPIPTSEFTSPESVYANQTSFERILDVLQHIFLPVIAIMYGSLAASSRLSRTAVLEVLRQDYVRTARAKGLPPFLILSKHVGRNAAITILTSIAGSLGIVLGGSLIVETLFEINGFGKFFYDAILNRDYNVIMFSVLAGSFLSLLGYLVADISYMLLDPRVTLE